jgi:outer membrane protein assembly factor BamB
MMKIWNISSRNHGRTYWASNVSGLPAIKSKWTLNECAEYGVDWEVCVNTSAIYLCSARRVAVAINVDNGIILWKRTLPEIATRGIAISESQICIAPYILSQSNGGIVSDLSRSGRRYRFVEDVYNGDFFITTLGEQKGIHRYGEVSDEFYNLGIVGLSIVNDGDLVIGLIDNALVSYSLRNKSQIWSLDCPTGEQGALLLPSSGYNIINDTIYQHMIYDSLRAINLESGEIIWQNGPQTIENLDAASALKIPPNKLLGCGDSLYLCREMKNEGFLQSRSVTDGSEMWRVDTPNARAFLIAGDLLFGALNDRLVGWDRYTGEVVWQADEPMTAVLHAVSASNKIIFTNTMSQIRCYEWTEPYYSPAKG